MFLKYRVAKDVELVPVNLQRAGIKCPEQIHDAQLIRKGLLNGLHLFCGLEAELDPGHLAFFMPERPKYANEKINPHNATTLNNHHCLLIQATRVRAFSFCRGRFKISSSSCHHGIDNIGLIWELKIAPS